MIVTLHYSKLALATHPKQVTVKLPRGAKLEIIDTGTDIAVVYHPEATASALLPSPGAEAVFSVMKEGH